MTHTVLGYDDENRRASVVLHTDGHLVITIAHNLDTKVRTAKYDTIEVHALVD